MVEEKVLRDVFGKTARYLRSLPRGLSKCFLQLVEVNGRLYVLRQGPSVHREVEGFQLLEKHLPMERVAPIECYDPVNSLIVYPFVPGRTLHDQVISGGVALTTAFEAADAINNDFRALALATRTTNVALATRDHQARAGEAFLRTTERLHEWGADATTPIVVNGECLGSLRELVRPAVNALRPSWVAVGHNDAHPNNVVLEEGSLNPRLIDFEYAGYEWPVEGQLRTAYWWRSETGEFAEPPTVRVRNGRLEIRYKLQLGRTKLALERLGVDLLWHLDRKTPKYRRQVASATLVYFLRRAMYHESLGRGSFIPAMIGEGMRLYHETLSAA